MPQATGVFTFVSCQNASKNITASRSPLAKLMSPLISYTEHVFHRQSSIWAFWAVPLPAALSHSLSSEVDSCWYRICHTLFSQTSVLLMEVISCIFYPSSFTPCNPVLPAVPVVFSHSALTWSHCSYNLQIKDIYRFHPNKKPSSIVLKLRLGSVLEILTSLLLPKIPWGFPAWLVSSPPPCPHSSFAA